MSGAISRATEEEIPSATERGRIALGATAVLASFLGSMVAAKDGQLELSLFCGLTSCGLLAAVISDIVSQRTM